MKIKNATTWNTRQLKRLVLAVAKHEMNPEHLKHYVVYVVHKKRDAGGCRGLAGRAPVGGGSWIGSHMTLYLPREGERLDSVLWAHVIAHEFAHNRGLQHRQMTGSKRYDYGDGWRDYYAWASVFLVERRAVQDRPADDPQMKRYAAVLVSQKRWAPKLKRAQNALKKLQIKQRYYERVLTAAGKLPLVG